MIIVSAGLVLTAVVLLIVGVVLAEPFLVMWSIAVSVLSAVFLVIGALLRRHELFPGGGRAGAAPPFPYQGPVPAGPPLSAPTTAPHQHQAAPHQHQAPAGPPPAAPHDVRRQAPAATRPHPAPAARQGPLDGDSIVLVIPGRRRYHLAGCRQLAGRDHEELTQEEAREEGFTPCTTCLPELTPAAQDASPEAPEPARPQAFKESGPAAADEPAAHEATARFSPPYGPVGPTRGVPVSAPPPAPAQPVPAALRESGPAQPVPPGTGGPAPQAAAPPAVRPPASSADAQGPAVPVARPYVQESAPERDPQGPPERPEPPRSPEPSRPPEPSQRREASGPPPGASAAPAFPVQAPAPSARSTEDSAATSWFSRDIAPAAPVPSPEPEPAAGPDRSEPPAPEPGGGVREPAAETASEVLDTASGTVEASGTEETASGAVETASGTVEIASGAVAEPALEGQASPEARGSTAEPVEPAETAPGRAGQPVAADSAPAAGTPSESTGAPAPEETPVKAGGPAAETGETPVQPSTAQAPSLQAPSAEQEPARPEPPRRAGVRRAGVRRAGVRRAGVRRAGASTGGTRRARRERVCRDRDGRRHRHPARGHPRRGTGARRRAPVPGGGPGRAGR
ncbi:hypothetical protein GCM10018955_52350 [Planomonospora venezuelensis]